MSITAITIENFKGIRDPVRIEFKPITLLFGPNSSGKSTILQALHYAREIFERENLDPGRTLYGGESMELGGYLTLVNNHDLSKPISLRFDLDLRGEDLPNYLPEDIDNAMDEIMVGQVPDFFLSRIRSAWVVITIKWSKWLNRPIISLYEVGLNEIPVGRISATEDGRQIFVSYLNINHPIFEVEEDEGEDGDYDDAIVPPDEEIGYEMSTIDENLSPEFNVNFPVLGQISALPKWGCFLEFQGEPWKKIEEEGWEIPIDLDKFFNLLTRVFVGPGELIRDSLRQLIYLGPIRSLPPRNYEPARSPDESRWATGLAAWDILQKAEQSFVEKTNDWLSRKDRLSSGYSIELKEYWELEIGSPLVLALLERRVIDEEESIESLKESTVKKRLILREETSGIEVLPQDVGIGISQVVPVIVAALHSRMGIVAMEQPELHIHPAFQIALGDLFISESSTKDVIYIIETHSEHLLLRLLRRVRETYDDELPPGIKGLTLERLAIYYVEKDGDMVKVSELKVSEEGDSLGRWPEGFFEERHGELY